MAVLTEADIHSLAEAWYRALDVHVPMVEIRPMLASNGLEMEVPEGKVTGLAGFEGWYQGVIRIFFDEVHTLKEVSASMDSEGGQAQVKVLVKWEASRWRSPAAKSERIIMDAYQTWTVTQHTQTGSPVILRYVVDRLEPYEGSAPL